MNLFGVLHHWTKVYGQNSSTHVQKEKKWPALLLFCQLGGWSVSTSNTSYALECTVCTTCTSASVLYSIKTLKDRNKSLFEWMNRWKNQRGRLFMSLEIYYYLNWYNKKAPTAGGITMTNYQNSSINTFYLCTFAILVKAH